jgi:hypothetical protein
MYYVFRTRGEGAVIRHTVLNCADPSKRYKGGRLDVDLAACASIELSITRMHYVAVCNLAVGHVQFLS